MSNQQPSEPQPLPHAILQHSVHAYSQDSPDLKKDYMKAAENAARSDSAGSTHRQTLAELSAGAGHQKQNSVHAHFLPYEVEGHQGVRSRSGSGSLADPKSAKPADLQVPQPQAAPAPAAESAPLQKPPKALQETDKAVVGDPRLPMNDGKLHILVAATGSISTSKMRSIIDKLYDIYTPDKVAVHLILTKAAEQFVNAKEIAAKARIWRDADEWTTWKSRTDPVLHIELRKWADILVIAPLSANTLGKIALGLCDNLLTNVVRAWNTQYPVLIAPSMLSYAYNHPATKRHLKVVKEEMPWIEVLKPVEKVVGSYGDIGMGGMMDWNEIVNRIVLKLGGYPEDDDDDDDDDEEDNSMGDDDEDDEDDEDDDSVDVSVDSKLGERPRGIPAARDDERDDMLASGVEGMSL